MGCQNSPDWCLWDAAKAGNNVGVLQALRMGASTSAVDTSVGGFTALHHAAYYGHHEVCSTLVSNGHSTNVDAQTPAGATALLMASRYGRENAVKTLLSLGANPNVCKGDGESPLHAACFGGKEAVVRALLAHGANIGAETKFEMVTPLHVAASRNFVLLVEALLQAGADADKCDKAGKTPFAAAQAKNASQEVLNGLTRYMKMTHAEGDWVYDPTVDPVY